MRRSFAVPTLAAATAYLVLGACSSSYGTADAPSPDAMTSESDTSTPPDDAGTDAEATPDAVVLDPCASKTTVCPTTTTTAGSGVVPIDRCAFPVDESPSWTTMPPLVKALSGLVTVTTVEDILANLNRDAMLIAPGGVPGAPAGVSLALQWASGDETDTSWTPQGITGSADATATGLINGRRILVVSWYWTPPAGSEYEKGVRLAFVDVTNPATPRYRLVLLVEPTGTIAAPSFKAVDVHAGGLVWIGNYLYVVATTGGFRVFDLSQVMIGDTTVDEIGCIGATCRSGLYAYFIPQIGGYDQKSDCGMIFSSASLDRSTTPPSIVSSEYCSGSACASPLAGRAYRWPLDATTNKLGTGRIWPSEAVLLGQQQVQGTATRSGLYYMSSSEPAGVGGALYRVMVGKSATSTWLDGPEDLMVDEPNQLLWTLSEPAGTRVVAGMRLSSYPAPP